MCLSSWEANKRQSQAQQRHIKHCVMRVCWCSYVVGWDGVPLALKGTGNRITDQATPLPAARIHSICTFWRWDQEEMCLQPHLSFEERWGCRHSADSAYWRCQLQVSTSKVRLRASLPSSYPLPKKIRHASLHRTWTRQFCFVLLYKLLYFFLPEGKLT